MFNWRFSFVILLAATILPGICMAAAPQPAAKTPPPAYSADSPLSVAVLQLKNSVGDEETAGLSAAIADSLSTALKNVASLSVADESVVVEEAAKMQTDAAPLKQADAIRLGKTLNVQVLLDGSYQHVGNQLRIDVQPLNIVAGKVLPGQVVHATCTYPDGYFGVLDELAGSVTKVLQVPVTAPEQGRVNGVLTNTASMEAYRLYADGKKQMQTGGRDGLTAAIDCFQQALDKDPDYALAFAAMSEAQLKLSRLQEDDGEDPVPTRSAAVESAKRAVTSRRSVGEAHRQLAHAYAATGNYQDAGVEAQSAVNDLPNDAAAYLELGKALGQGTLSRNAALDRALRLGPWLARMEAQFPRVTVLNNSQYDIEASFVLGNAEPYARVQVSPNSSRLVGLIPGDYQVVVHSVLGNKDEDFTFESGKDYNLTYDATTWPIALVHVANKTGVPLSIKVGDAKAYILNGQTQTLKLQPGTFNYQAKAGPATGSGSKTFEAGVYDWVFSASSFPKAVITVANRTHSTLTLQVDGRTPLAVPAGKDKQLVLYPGSHSFRASAGGLTLSGNKQFDAGESVWTFSGGSFPTATINIENTGNVTVHVSIKGPTSRSVNVGGNRTVQLIVAPGNYAVHASAGGATQDDTMYLSSGDEKTLTYTVVQYYR